MPQVRATGLAMVGNASATMGGGVAWSLEGSPPAWLGISEAGVLTGTAAQPYGNYAFRVVARRDGIAARTQPLTFQVTPPGNLASNVRPTSIGARNPNDSSFSPTSMASDTVTAAHDRSLTGSVMTYNMSTRASGKYMAARYPTVYADGCYLAAVVTPKALLTLSAYFSFQDGTGKTYHFYTQADASGLIVMNGGCDLGQGKHVTSVNWTAKNWTAKNWTSTIRFTEARLSFLGASAP